MSPTRPLPFDDEEALLDDERPQVLIVEDDPVLHRLLAECLRTEYAVSSSFDGESALSAVLANAPDLVIVDLGLPRMDGAHLIGAVRQRHELNDIPIIVVTGTIENSRVADLLDSGVQDFLRKPFVMGELRARVRNLITAKRTRDVLNQTIGRHETDLVKLATQVAQRQSDLESVLQELEKARGHAELAGRVKSNFLRMMSHELKTPVTAMHLHMRMIERDPDVQGLPTLHEGLDRISRSTRRLLHLVDTVLEWARVESGRCRVTVEEFDLATLVDEIVNETRPYARQKQIELRTQVEAGLPSLPSDRRMVRLLLVDMINRAVQATDEGCVELTLRDNGDEQQVSFRDGSPALTEGERIELFEPLQDAGDLAQRSGTGSGLGLQVTRDLAQAIAGDVTLEPHDGVGNVFTLTLPKLALGLRSVAPKTEMRSVTTH